MEINVTTRVNSHLFTVALHKLESKAIEAIEELAKTGQSYAKELVSGTSPSPPGAPPGLVTGRLRAGIITHKVSNTHWLLVSNAPYSIYLELGTVNMAARPFMRPTAYHLKKIAPEVIKNSFKDLR